MNFTGDTTEGSSPSQERVFIDITRASNEMMSNLKEQFLGQPVFDVRDRDAPAGVCVCVRFSAVRGFCVEVYKTGRQISRQSLRWLNTQRTLAVITPGNPRLQPKFLSRGTKVQACQRF